MSQNIAGAQPSSNTKTEEKGKKPAFPERDATRRDFLKVSVATGVGVCAVGAPICAAVRLVTAPVFAEGTGGKLYPLTTFDSLTEQPQKFFIIDDKKDAWTTLPQQKIGSLFLRKVGETVQALHSLCPHAGCMLQLGRKENPQTKEEQELFYCPCHGASFDLDGGRLNTVSPRDMDSLEVEIKDGQVCVKFENYTFGIADKRVT